MSIKGRFPPKIALTPKKSPNMAGRPCRTPCRVPRCNPHRNLGAGRPRPSRQTKCCATGRRGLKPCQKMPKIPAENSRPEASGKEIPPGPGVGRRTGRGLHVRGPSRPKYPPVSSNGPLRKTSGWRWLDPSNSREQASRVPRDMRVSRSPFRPCQKHRGTPGTPLGPGAQCPRRNLNKKS